MYFEQHTDYLKQYKKGVKKISFRNKRPVISKDFEFILENCYRGYDLLFSAKGLLDTSYEYFYRNNKITNVEKYSYAYSDTGKLLHILSINAITNVLTKSIQFDYDEEGRIESEYIMHYSRSIYYFEQEIRHSYGKNYHKVEYNDEGLEEELYYIGETWFNDNGHVVEYKFWSSEAGIHVWDKYELNEAGEILKQYYINDQGEKIEEEPPDYQLETIVEADDNKGFLCETDFKDGELIRIREMRTEFY